MGPGGIPKDHECEVIENDAPVPKHIPCTDLVLLEAFRSKKDEPAVTSAEEDSSDDESQLVEDFQNRDDFEPQTSPQDSIKNGTRGRSQRL
ncbi:hypothetical protein L1049_018189 [Liquidambar formosana]|uniref:Uncharacterized protein n=1 Tax=Liquidambar formosana TaxID=63359 RepID=A0AAP0R9P4_LIQFO